MTLDWFKIFVFSLIFVSLPTLTCVGEDGEEEQINYLPIYILFISNCIDFQDLYSQEDWKLNFK